jgi:hypothetical protein
MFNEFNRFKFLAALLLSLHFSLLSAMPLEDVNKWKADLAFYQDMLEKKHISLYHNLSADKMKAAIELIEGKLPEISHNEAVVELMKLTKSIGDGHTSIPLWNQKRHYFPFELFYFDDALRIVSSSEQDSNLIGASLVSIDDVPIFDIFKKVSAIAPFVENEFSNLERATSYLRSGELLQGLGVIDDYKSARFEFEDSKSVRFSITLQSVNYNKLDKMLTRKLTNSPSLIPQPDFGILSNNTGRLWFSVIDSLQTVYIKFNEYPTSETMYKFSKDILDVINHKKLEHIIIDLRHNYGGDLYIGMELAHQLNLADSVDWKKGVFVLIGRTTYSAAMVNAALYRQLLNARLVGEPAGGLTRGYQDMGQIILPNSKLIVSYSKRYFKIESHANSNLMPDVMVKPDWKSFKQGKDNALDWIFNEIKNLD